MRIQLAPTMMPKILLSFLGVEADTTSHAEKLISAVGGFVGILLVIAVSRYFVGNDSVALLVASMGASAVLLFAVPHGTLAQPWPLVGGHLVSALVGVTCSRLVPDPLVAAALAVSLAITAMYYLRCIHPPGGATALTAVVGGPQLHALGYAYVVTPVLLNVMLLLVTAIAVNYFFPWRRYPYCMICRQRKPAPEEEREEPADMVTEISHGDLEYALRQIDSYVDVTEDDLTRIYALAAKHSLEAHMEPSQIKLGRYYSNGRYGRIWAVRHVVDESGDNRSEHDTVVYKVVAGAGRRSSGSCSREELADWAKYEVIRNENSWQRVGEGGNAIAPA